MDMAQNELAATVAAPAPVPTPVPATISVALTGWSPSTITELEAAGDSEVSADPRELVYMPAPAPVPVRAPPPTVAPAPVHLAAPAEPMPVPVCAPPLSGMGRCRRPLPLSGASCRPPTPRPSIARRHDV